MTEPRHGMKRAVAVACAEQREDGTWARTWDVWSQGKVVSSGYRTRAEARTYAGIVNDVIGECDMCGKTFPCEAAPTGPPPYCPECDERVARIHQGLEEVEE